MFRVLIIVLALWWVDSIQGQTCPSGSGHFRDPSNCAKYFYCEYGEVVLRRTCSEGLHYKTDTGVCVPPEKTDCQATTSPETTAATDAPEESTEPDTESETTDATDAPEESTEPDSSLPEISRPNPPSGSSRPTNGYRVICYFTNYGWYRPEGGKFGPENINVDLCTHINYGFAVLDETSLTIKSHDTWIDIDSKFYKRVIALKKAKPSLRVLLSLGGWTDSEGDKYSRMVSQASSRRKFIEHSVGFLSQHGFDGLDLDWEFPRCWQALCEAGPESDRTNFAHLVRELSQVFRPRGWLLTAAFSASARVINQAYDIPSLASNFDFINLMTYDFHGQWERVASHHSPLYAVPNSNDQTSNSQYAVNLLITRGMPKSKIVLGIPFYGRSFTLAQPANSHTNRGFGAAATGGGEPGPITKEKGSLAFNEICYNLKNRGWTQFREPSSGLPAAYHGNQWVGYDDVEQVKKKAEFIKQVGIGGAMIWALDHDDFGGRCSSTKYPLLQTLNENLK